MRRATEQAVRNIVQRYVEALRDESADTRRDAASALGELRADEAVTPLMALLVDPMPEVQIAAVAALGKIADLRAVPALEEKGRELSVWALVDSRSQQVRAACLEAAERIKNGDKGRLPRASAFDAGTGTLPRSAWPETELNNDTLPRATSD